LTKAEAWREVVGVKHNLLSKRWRRVLYKQTPMVLESGSSLDLGNTNSTTVSSLLSRYTQPQRPLCSTIITLSFSLSLSHCTLLQIKVKELFRKMSPGGSTDLAGVLRLALKQHWERGGTPETILVITDGEPNEQEAVKRVITQAANRLERDEDLSISFIQIGNDKQAHRFLKVHHHHHHHHHHPHHPPHHPETISCTI
jgi:hypothetical protein